MAATCPLSVLAKEWRVDPRLGEHVENLSLGMRAFCLDCHASARSTAAQIALAGPPLHYGVERIEVQQYYAFQWRFTRAAGWLLWGNLAGIADRPLLGRSETLPSESERPQTRQLQTFTGEPHEIT